jgi:hypothetical protein
MQSTMLRISLGRSMIAVAAFAFGLAISPPGSPFLALLTPVALGIAALRRWSIAVPALMFLGPCAFAEILMDLPVPAWIYVPTALLVSGPLWPKDPAGWRSRRLIPLIAVNALILALYWIPWSSRKPFVRHLDSIRPGMTVAEVNRIMAGYRMGTGIPLPGSAQEFRPSGAIVFRHSDEAMFNADWGVVTFRDGKVVDVRFDPD